MSKVHISDTEVVIIHYKFPLEKREENSPLNQLKIFLSHNQMTEIQIIVIYRFDPVRFYTNEVNKEIHFPDAIEFTIYPDRKSEIQNVERLFEQKSGSIYKLLEKAQKSRNRKAEKNNIIIKLGSSAEVKTADDRINGMKFYELTEKSYAILNDVVAAYSRLTLKINEEKNPDKIFLKAIEENKSLALDILEKAENFSSLTQMQEIIDKYGPIAKELNSVAFTQTIAV